MDEAHARIIMDAIRRWNVPTLKRYIRDGTLTPEMRLTDTITGWRMPLIGHLIENMGYGAHAVFEVLPRANWDPWAQYEIETPGGGRVRTTLLCHIIEFYVERRRGKSAMILSEALLFFYGEDGAPMALNIPFRLDRVNSMGQPILSKWSALSGQSLCAVMTQALPEPIEFLRTVLNAGARFHAGDPPGLFVLATFGDTPFEQAKGQVTSLMDFLRDHKDHINHEMVRAIEPISGRNLFHWMVAATPWDFHARSLIWINTLHAYGFKTYTRTRDGHTVMELARSKSSENPLLIDALRTMQEMERNVRVMIATKNQAMRTMGFPLEIAERVRSYGPAWDDYEARGASWEYRRPRASTHTAWDFMSDWHPFDDSERARLGSDGTRL
jgi:hypothetical protein